MVFCLFGCFGVRVCVRVVCDFGRCLLCCGSCGVDIIQVFCVILDFGQFCYRCFDIMFGLLLEVMVLIWVFWGVSLAVSWRGF